MLNPLGMNSQSDDSERAQALTGWLLGLTAVLIFGMTLPAVRIALQGFDPWFIGFCRAVIATAAGGALLVTVRQPLPQLRDLRSLTLAAIGVVLGFPLLMNWAMQSVPASHGGVVLGLLPLATAIAAVIWNRERPSQAFWLTGVVGSGCAPLKDSRRLADDFLGPRDLPTRHPARDDRHLELEWRT